MLAWPAGDSPVECWSQRWAQVPGLLRQWEVPYTPGLFSPPPPYAMTILFTFVV